MVLLKKIFSFSFLLCFKLLVSQTTVTNALNNIIDVEVGKNRNLKTLMTRFVSLFRCEDIPISSPTPPTSNPTSTCSGSISGWTDSDGNSCAWYAAGDSEFKCGTYGRTLSNQGFVANDACCACKTACPMKKIKIEEFCIEGDADIGSAEIQIKVNGQRYYPMNDDQCTPDPSGFCSWAENRCHTLNGASWRLIENISEFTIGTEEDDFAFNDAYTTAMSINDWHDPHCSPYEIKFGRGFEQSLLNQVCWNDLGSSLEMSNGRESCEGWLNPSDSYTFRMLVYPQYNPTTSEPTESPSILPSALPIPTNLPTLSPTPNVESCSGSTPGWRDSEGRSCSWYATGDAEFKCSTYGSAFRNLGFVANEACCTCKTACPSKEVQIHRFCILGDADSGPSAEIQLRLNGEKYFPQNDSQCSTDPSGFCSWREGQCHNLNGAAWKEVNSFGSLSVGTEEDDWSSENDSYTTTMSSNDWHSSQCAPYEVKFSINFEQERINTRCWNFSVSVSGKIYAVEGERNGGVEQCTTWVDPAESYVWFMYVFPRYEPIAP